MSISVRRISQFNIWLWIFVGFLLILTIGLRHKVGGDWSNYLNNFQLIQYYTLEDVLTGADPGYNLISYLVHTAGFDIYSVNVICAMIFVIGLIKFSRQQFFPWLTLAVAIPYLIIVVAMGYTRQAVAIGLIMWAIAVLQEKKFIRFLVLVVLAATFHKSAVLIIGIGLFGHERGRLLKIVAIGFVGFGIYEAFLSEYEDQIWANYVEAEMESQGAKIRVMMNFIPGLLFFLLRKRWKENFDDYEFWRILALGSIVAVFFVGYASTAVDRMALYMIPLQLVVFGRLPFLISHKLSPHIITILILIYYSVVQFVWLNFATHAQYWLPYENYLWYDLF